MSREAKFWDKVYSQKQVRLNRRHHDIWGAVSPFLKGKVLDLGCGPCVMYEGKDIDLTGMDISGEALKQARLHYPKGKYIIGDVNNLLPFSDQSYDTIILLGLLDYFKDWTHIINECKRVIKPNGKIIATLLHDFRGHDWSKYSRITSNWHFYEIQ